MKPRSLSVPVDDDCGRTLPRNALSEPRRIRSFVRREGRLTEAQKRALATLWDRFGLSPNDAPLDLAALFGRDAPCFLEIGFGDGEALAALAARYPDNDYLGIEVHRPGIGHLLLELERRALANVRLFQADAVEILEHHIPDHALAGIFLFFPDPWPKKRHQKRRIVQLEFLNLAARKLKPGGLLHLATDWQDYAEQMLRLLNDHPGFVNRVAPRQFAPRPDYRPETKFERRGRRLGHSAWDLLFATRRAPDTSLQPLSFDPIRG